jgi:hypothetical protein
MMRRLILALVLGGGLFGVVFAAAANLNLGSSGNLQAGQSTVAQCQGATPITISYVTVPNAAAAFPSGYQVTAVTFGTFQAACSGKTLQFALLNATGVILATNSITLPTATAGFTDTIPVLNVDAGQLNSTTVAILN